MAARSRKAVPLELTADMAELVLTPEYIYQKAKPFLPWALAAILIAFVIGYAVGPYMGWRARNPGITVAIPPLPVVEPLTLRKVTMSEARTVNAATPLTKAVIPACRAVPVVQQGRRL